MNMNENLAREILMSHADTLAAGHDVTETLAARYPDLAPMLRLARDVDSVLAMVPVSAEYKQALKANLLQRHTPAPELAGHVLAGPATERNGWLVPGAVAVGSALTGLAVYGLSRFMTEGDEATAAPAQ